MVEKGRTKTEKSFIYLKKGRYAGYGFIENSEELSEPSQFDNYLIPQENSNYADRILNSYLKNKKHIKKIALEPQEEAAELQKEEWFG